MKPTEGMVRGMKAEALGEPITVPVGRATLGRVLNVLGEPVDNLGPVTAEKRYPIHRAAPTLEDQSTQLEMFETGSGTSRYSKRRAVSMPSLIASYPPSTSRKRIRTK